MDIRLKRHWATNIRKGRKSRKMSQADLARRCEVEQSTVSRWERFEVIPTEDNKLAIAKAFGIEDPREVFPLRVPAPLTVPSRPDDDPGDAVAASA